MKQGPVHNLGPTIASMQSEQKGEFYLGVKGHRGVVYIAQEC
jgi:hypothetical protein